MKNFYFTIISLLFCSVMLFSCSNDDEPSSNESIPDLQQYKWVCRFSDEPLVDDDFEWAIFDDYVITLYFVSDYECVTRFYRKHYDTSEGTSYDRQAQTVEYYIIDNNITLGGSKYTVADFVYGGAYLTSEANQIFEREEITSSDREWIEENYKHIKVEPDKSTSKAFKGLKEIYANHWEGVAFGNPHLDNEGRLTYYKAMYMQDMEYEYSGNTIINQRGFGESYDIITYTLTNGLITSYVNKWFDDTGLRSTYDYTVKYDNNRRISQVIREGGYDTEIYYYRWNSSGDLEEIKLNYKSGYDGKERSGYTYTYKYLSSIAQFPSMILGKNELWCPYNHLDPILVVQGYFGNSMPKHNLKSMYMVMEPEQKPYESYNWSYTFDSKNRIVKTIQEYKDLYDNGKTDETGEYTFLWE